MNSSNHTNPHHINPNPAYNNQVQDDINNISGLNGLSNLDSLNHLDSLDNLNADGVDISLDNGLSFENFHNPTNPIAISPDLQKNHAVVNASTRRQQWQSKQQEKNSVINRLFFAVICAVMLGLVGGLIDIVLIVIRSLTTAISTAQWLFAPILAVIGLLLGLFAHSHAGGYAMQLMNVFASDDTNINSGNSGFLRAVGVGIVLSFLGYIIMMVLA